MAGRKKPWLAAILAGLLGPLGFIYLGWRYGVTQFLMLAVLVIPITLMGLTMRSWFKYPCLLLFAYLALTLAKAMNADAESGKSSGFSPWYLAIATATNSAIPLAMLLMGLFGLVAAVELLASGQLLRGLLMLLIGTPLFVIVAQFIVGWIAMGIDGVALLAFKEKAVTP